jgi:hypothetical protein
MDIAIHWGLVRHLREEVEFNIAIPLVAIVIDFVVLSAFIYLKYLSDQLVLIVAAI